MRQMNYPYINLFKNSKPLASLICLLFTVLFSNINAQVGTPTFYNAVPTTSANTFPLNTTANTKVQWIYGPGTFSTTGTAGGTFVTSGNLITKIYIRFQTVNATTVYPDLTISLTQNGTTASLFPDGTYITPMTPVVSLTSFQFTGIVTGSWYGFTLPTPFPYDPAQSLIVELKSTLTTSGGNSVNSITGTGNQRIYGPYAATSATAGTGLTPVGFDVMPASLCVDPPTAGSATSNLTTVCSGQPVTLGLSGNSIGVGQTYQWESSNTLAGPYTPLGSAGLSPTLTINPTSTSYYRCQVTCGTSTLPSTEVQVNVPPLFPGGNYTINSGLPTGGANFTSFTDAVAALSCGIAGAVTFDVDAASGPYVEQISLPATIGATATNTVTFNGNGRVLSYASADANNRHVIKLNGADYITFNDLEIDGSAGTYGWGVHLINNADYNNFNFCTFKVSTSNITAVNHACVVMSSSVTSATSAGDNGDFNTFADNNMTGGYYTISLYGNSAAGLQSTNNIFTNNQIKDYHLYGLLTLYQKNMIVSGNDISRPARTTSGTNSGVYVSTGCQNNLFENNRVHNVFDAMPTNTSTSYGMASLADATSTEPNRFINNVIYNINGAGIIYGIYNSSGDNLRAYHNTISLDNPAITTDVTYGIYQTTAATGLEFRNNVITVTRGGTAAKVGLYYNTVGSTINSNNNAVYVSGAGTSNFYGSSSTTGFATLAGWQTANGGVYDANSVFADPVYISPATGDFEPTAIATNNVGAALGIGFDIDGNIRSALTPDPGAYEYSLAGLDASISWVSPTSPTTAGLKTISVNINNNLSTTITNLVLTYTDGVTPVTETFSGLNILSSNSQLFSFATQYNVTSNVQMRAYITSVNGVSDNSQANDTTALQNLCLTISGAYTINSAMATSGSNFQSFSALVSTLNCGGISGPVTVDVVPGSGPYTEQVTFNAVSGSSATNTITINGNNNTLTFPSGANYHTLRLNGIDYLTINNLNVATTGTANGIAMLVSNASDNNNFNNCTFSVPLAATATTTSAVAISASTTSAVTGGNNGNNNIFTGCTMTGGYYCISVYGTTSTINTGNQFISCNVTDFYLYGVYNLYGGSTIVRNCVFERPNRTAYSSTYGVFLTTGSANCLVEQNRVRNLFPNLVTSTSLCYAYYCSATASVGNENKFINNLAHDLQGNGTQAGIYLTGANHLKAYHNTISLDYTAATAGTTYGIYSTGATNVDIQNNVVSVTRGGTGAKHCLYYTTLPTTTNYNALYINSAAGTNYVAYDGVTLHTTLAAYISAQPTKDQLTVEVNPGFVNPTSGNFQPTEVTLNNSANNVGVVNDINNVIRSVTPDRGAYEFFVAPQDLAVLNFVSPGTGGCYSASQDIVLTIKNFGTSTLDFSVDSATVTAIVSGATTATLTVTPTGTLAAGATMNITLSSVDMTTSGTYNFSAYVTLIGDGNPLNDSLNPTVSRIANTAAGTVTSSVPSLCVSGTPILTVTGNVGGTVQWQESTVSATGPWTNVGTGTNTYTPASAVTQTTYYQVEVTCNALAVASNVVTVTVNNPTLVSTTPGSRCGIGTVNLSATVGSGATANWYANATGGLPLATSTTSFTTPSISSTTDFYVAASSGGVTANVGKVALSPGSTQNTGTAAYILFDALSPFTLNTIDIYPYGTVNAVAGTMTISLDNSAGVSQQTTTVSVVAYTAANPTVQTVPINFNITPGTGYRLRIAGYTGGVTGALRDLTTANPAPVFPYTLPGIVSITNSSIAGYYYYFYNWSVSTGCEGPRTVVTATVNTPPSIAVTTTDPTLCPGGTTTVSVTSPNDPDYTYTWTSNPVGFTANGAGPHSVSPTNTTKYIVSAIDNTSGIYAGCATIDSVTVITSPVLSAGTVSSTLSTICISGTPTLSVTGAAGGSIQWQESTVGATGPWTNVGTGGTSYTPGVAITQTTYYRTEVSCQATSVQSNVVEVIVNNPQIVTTTPAVVCGTSGSANISATASAGANVSWFDNATGGTALATGNTYTTPVISSTTTYYAEANFGSGGGTASPLQVTEIDLGSTDQFEIQNVSPDPLDVTGWKVAVSDNYTNIAAVNAIVKVLSGTLNPGDRLTWSDASASSNYWGNNLFWNPGAQASFTGWAAILDNNNILRDIVFMNWNAAAIAAASITIGTTTITVGTQWTGNGVDITTVAATNSVSRQGTSDNNNLSDFAIIPLSMNATNPGMTLPFTGFGCAGTRVPVVVTVGPCSSTLNLNLFIEGYWDGTSAMLPVLANQGQANPVTDCDSITVELRDENSPYSALYTTTAVLQTNGSAVCTFSPGVTPGNYYIAVKHRNALQTWSAAPVAIGATSSYNFTTAATQAYGTVAQVEVATGVWALFSGDVVIDENMDLLDIGTVESDASSFLFGYFSTDLNGDGNVDLLDTPVIEINAGAFVFSQHP